MITERKDLLDVLTAWEGAVSVVERDGDDSAEAIADLSRTRGALLEVLSQYRDIASENVRLRHQLDIASRAQGRELERATIGTGEMGQ